MKEFAQIDYSQPFIAYKNKGTVFRVIGKALCLPLLIIGLQDLIFFHGKGMMSLEAELILVLCSAGLWWLLRYIARHRHSEEPVIIVSNKGIRSFRDTDFVHPWFVTWGQFERAYVDSSSIFLGGYRKVIIYAKTGSRINEYVIPEGVIDCPAEYLKGVIDRYSIEVLRHQSK